LITFSYLKPADGAPGTDKPPRRAANHSTRRNTAPAAEGAGAVLRTVLPGAGNPHFGAAAFDFQAFGRKDTQPFQALDIAGALHLHHADLVAHDHRVVHGHAEHPDFVENAGRIEFAGVLRNRTQAQHVAFATEHREFVGAAFQCPGGAALVAVAG